MQPPSPATGRAAAPGRTSVLARAVAAVDDTADRLWSSALNPLHQSGTIAIVSFGVLVVTGLYLFLFYSIDAPYESVARIETELPGGAWVRTLHTHAADLALAATAVHALKMLATGRCFGPRTRAWLTGVVLLGVTLLCGWTGQVMAWDLQGQVVAVEMTRLLDLLPLFSMPMGRAFDGLAPVPGSFFFMNLFLHVCLPLGLGLVLWLHLSRLARPALLPPRPLLWGTLASLALLAALVAVPLAPRADLLTVPRDVPVDLLYNFWLPVAWRVGPAWHAALWTAAAATTLTLPWWWPRTAQPPATRDDTPSAGALLPSWVDADHCTGCTTCYKDCPFDAITMVPRPDPGRRSEIYALVNPDRCVSCGVCAGSCAPMSVGPPGRTGRDQLRDAHAAVRADAGPRGDVVVFACAKNAAANDARLAAMDGVSLWPVDCAGGLHTSVLELALRSGASGAFVLACPPRTAPCREGPKWLVERVFHDREAELPPRVDKRRVAVAGLSRGEWPAIAAAIEDLRKTVRDLDAGQLPAVAGDGAPTTECEPVPLTEVRRA